MKNIIKKESLLTFSFPNDKIRDEFLGQLCDGGVEDSITLAMESHNINIKFDYKTACSAWGWNGKGTPIVDVILKNNI